MPANAVGKRNTKVLQIRLFFIQNKAAIYVQISYKKLNNNDYSVNEIKKYFIVAAREVLCISMSETRQTYALRQLW